MSLTNLEVIDTALELGQFASNTTFRALARKYYNVFLKSDAQKFSYPFYRKSQTVNFLSGQKEYNIPTDYMKSDNIYRLNTTNNVVGAKIPIFSNWKFDQLSIGNLYGTPTCATVDEDTEKVKFNAAHSDATGKGYKLNYFREPIYIDVDGNDDANTPDYPLEELLINGIIMWLYIYQDDERQNNQISLVDKIRRDLKINVFDYDDNSTVELGNAFVAGSRPRRGGGNFGWGQ